MDTVSKKKRSEIMSRIKSRDSKIEILLAKNLKRGFRYRKNSGKYFGKPDIVLKRHKTVIFVDSCFGMGVRSTAAFQTARKNYWVEKMPSRNAERDREIAKALQKTAGKF